MEDVKNIKTVGILGGMGPEATVDLMRRIIAHTSAEDDIDHVHCLVDQNPQVPSRIKVLLEGGNVSPGPCMSGMAKGLERGGADFLCIACNTAHNWYGEIADAVSVPVLNMIEIAARDAAGSLKIQSKPASLHRAGILASPAVRLTGLYEAPCHANGLEAIYADPDFEGELLGVIRAIKSGDTGENIRKRLAAVVRHMEEKGADVLIVACTELGVVGLDANVPLVDAADALAMEIVQKAGGKLMP